MIVSVGTRNPAKLKATESAIRQMVETFNRKDESPALLHSTQTSTSVPDMPLTLKDIMQGAQERALFTYKKFPKSAFALGLEGGVYRQAEHGMFFLQSWAYAYNGKSGFFGSSAALPLPPAITSGLYEDGLELSSVIDALSGKKDVRSKEGTFGILTGNLISRSQSFQTAIIAALTPFFNHEFYEI